MSSIKDKESKSLIMGGQILVIEVELKRKEKLDVIVTIVIQLYQ
jgi:hypothetical protein